MNRAIIIDDEFDARRVLKKYLERYFPNVEVLGEADCVEQGIALIEETRPDLMFLDIKMGDGTGFDLLDQLTGHIPKVIFTTAYDEFALTAFKYHALDYLLKPIDPEIFEQSVKRVLTAAPAGEPKEPIAWSRILSAVTGQEKKIAVPSSEGMRFIPINDIIYCEADSSYSTLFLKDKKQLIISKPLKYFADKLEAEPFFFRPHKSFLININYLEEYIKQDGGFLKLSNGKLIPISRNKKDEVIEKINAHFV